jgi:hypothetical protein
MAGGVFVEVHITSFEKTLCNPFDAVAVVAKK